MGVTAKLILIGQTKKLLTWAEHKFQLLCISLHHTLLQSTMRCHIPEEYKEIAIHMSLNEGVSDEDIHCIWELVSML